MSLRELRREEIQQMWSIDRSEIIDNIYHHEDGQLVLKPEHYDLKGWPAGEAENSSPWFLDCFDRGGTFYGAFENANLIGAAVLGSRFIGLAKDQLQLIFLHVSRSHRGTGLGRKLFELTVARARELGARRLYISSNPSENTVKFYLYLGCRVTEELNRELYEEEPEDIHLEYDIPK